MSGMAILVNTPQPDQFLALPYLASQRVESTDSGQESLAPAFLKMFPMDPGCDFLAIPGAVRFLLEYRNLQGWISA